MQSDQQFLKAQDIVKTHVLLSAGAGLVPFPILDIAAVTAVQVDMLRQLSRLYAVDYYENGGKGLVAALTGSTLARLGASMVKAIPGIGTLLGGVSMAAMSGASTYAVGQVFVQHFGAGGDFSNFDPGSARRTCEEEMEKGKKMASQWKKEHGAQPAPPEEDVLKKLEKLGELKAKGVLSEEEFQKMKEKLLAAI